MAQLDKIFLGVCYLIKATQKNIKNNFFFAASEAEHTWVMALMNMTGIIGNSSLIFDSTIPPAEVSHRAPSMYRPQMLAPSLGGALQCENVFSTLE